MKILIALPHEYSRGRASAKRIRDIARGLRAAGAEVRVLAISQDDCDIGSDWRVGGSGTLFRIYAAPPLDASRLQRIRFRLGVPAKMRAAVEAALQEYPADAMLLSGHTWFFLRKTLGLCRARNLPVFKDFTEWFPWRRDLRFRPAFWDHAACRRLLLPRLTGIIGISNFWRGPAGRYGLALVIVPALAEEGAPELAPMPSEGPLVLGYIGAMSDRDLPVTMVEGVRLAVKRGVDVRLVAIGRTSSCPAAIKAISIAEQDPALRDRVEFTGWVDDDVMREKLDQCSAMVLLRRNDEETAASFPTRLPELMETGRAVIHSSAGDPTFYLEHGRGVWLIPEGDHPEALAEALAELASDRAHVAEIGQCGRAESVEHFGYRKHGKRVLEFMEEVIRLRETAPEKVARLVSVPEALEDAESRANT
jgi:glycosyltransferase involved in cell wall biosynthesis